MKRTNMLIAALITGLIFLNFTYADNAFASDGITAGTHISDNGIVTVNGVCSQKKQDVNITITVLKPEKQIENITPLNIADNVLISNQIKTTDGGEFLFKFKFGGDYGKYAIYINEQGGNTPYCIYATNYKNITGEFKCENLGNIFFDYSNIKFNLNVSANINEVSTVKGNYTVLTQDGQSVLKNAFSAQTDSKGNAVIPINFSLSKSNVKYGFYVLKAEITDEQTGKSAVIQTRFSSIKSALNSQNHKMGIQQHLENGYGNDQYGAKDMDSYLNLIKQSGINVHRDDVHWHVMEKTKGNFALRSDQKKIFGLVSSKEFSPLITLGSSNKIYDKYQINENGEKTLVRPYYNTEYTEAYGRYCYEAVKNTISFTSEYEILNEKNHIPFNSFLEAGDDGYPVYKDIDYKEYVMFMKAAYENAHKAAEEAEKDITVYGIAAAYIPTMYEWIDGIFKNGGGRYMDALSFHIYTNDKSPEKSGKTEVVNKVKQIMSKYGYGNMKVIISETGYSTNINTLVQQAKCSLRDWAMLYNKTDKLIYYNAIEKPNPSAYEHNLGFLKMPAATDDWTAEIPYEAKPVFAAISNWNALAANSDLISENVYGTKYEYTFKTPDMRYVTMLWNSSEQTSKIYVNARYSNAVLYDMYGNETAVSPVNGKYEIEISGEPVYLEEKEYSIDFTDKDGTKVCNISDAKDEINVNVLINDAEVLNNTQASIIIAYYDSQNNLLRAKVNNITVGKTISDSIALNKNISRISVFIWDSLNNLKPLPINKTIN